MLSKKTFFVLFLFLIVNILPLNATAQIHDDYPNLNKIYQTESKKTNFIIAIDRSGSMKKLWPEVKNQIIDFINALPDGDYVSIIGFGDKADNLLIPRTLTSESKQNLQSELSSLSFPKEQNTDLFAGIDKILEEINRPNSNPLSFVFIFTDFENDPPLNIIKDYPLTKQLPDLNEKYKNYIIKTNRLVRVYALQLPLSTKAGSDYDKVSKIFEDNVQRVYLNKNVMHEWFQRIRSTVQREKTNLLVQSDLKSPIAINGINTSLQKKVSISIKNKSQLPLVVKHISLETEKYGTVKEAFNEEIKPGKEKEFALSYNEQINQLDIFIQKELDVLVKVVNVGVSLPYQAEMAKLNINPIIDYNINYDKKISIVKGIRYWQIAVGLIVIFMLAYISWLVWFKPEWIFNKRPFNVSLYLNHDKLEIRNQHYDTSMKQKSIKRADLTDNESVADFTITLIPRKPKFLRKSPQRGTYINCQSSDLSQHFRIEKKQRGKIEKVDIKNYSEPVSVQQGISLSCDYYKGGDQSLTIIIS